MKQVISVKDLQEMVRSGQNVAGLPPDALLTPLARDFLRDLESKNPARRTNQPSAGVLGPDAKPLSSGKPKPESETLPNSKLEILEAYCRAVLAAGPSGRPASALTPAQLQDLFRIKQALGSHGLKECELCDNNEWRPGATCPLPQGESPTAGFDPEAEAAVKAITDQIMAELIKNLG